MNEIGAGRFLFFILWSMEKEALTNVLEKAAAERGCILVELEFDDDENVFTATIDKPDADVELGDCEYVHRAVLAAFDRNIEDYSMTVTSLGIDAAEADEILKTIEK